jgi:hypothetical protein
MRRTQGKKAEQQKRKAAGLAAKRASSKILATHAKCGGGGVQPRSVLDSYMRWRSDHCASFAGAAARASAALQAARGRSPRVLGAMATLGNAYPETGPGTKYSSSRSSSSRSSSSRSPTRSCSPLSGQWSKPADLGRIFGADPGIKWCAQCDVSQR